LSLGRGSLGGGTGPDVCAPVDRRSPKGRRRKLPRRGSISLRGVHLAEHRERKEVAFKKEKKKLIRAKNPRKKGGSE